MNVKVTRSKMHTNRGKLRTKRSFECVVDGITLKGEVIFCVTHTPHIKFWYTFKFENPLVKKSKDYKIIRYQILAAMIKKDTRMAATALRAPK